MMGRRHPWLYRLAWLRRNRCSLLLGWLCVLILANPVFTTTRLGAKSLAIGLMGVLLLAIWALRVPRSRLLAALVLAAGAAVAIVLSPGEQHWLRPVAVGAVTVLIGAATVALLRYVLDWHVISIDKVFGSVAAYVLIALTFACLFNLLTLVQPNAFYIAQVNDPDGHMGVMYVAFLVARLANLYGLVRRR